jgi:tetratricopeptide (TPR) repeat protein
LPPNHSSIGDTMFYIGLVYKNQGKYDEALSYLKQSLEPLPLSDSAIAVTLNTIGIVYFNQVYYLIHYFYFIGIAFKFKKINKSRKI